jgi:hypothetical protein
MNVQTLFFKIKILNCKVIDGIDNYNFGINHVNIQWSLNL